MSNINKILITVVVCVFMICVATVSTVKIVTDKGDTTAAEITSDEQSVQTPESTSQAPSDTSSGVPAVNASTSAVDATANANASTAPGETTAVTELKAALIGKWSDSLGMMGYEFFEDDTVNVTVFDLKQLVGLDLEGTQRLPYTHEGDILTLNFH